MYVLPSLNWEDSKNPSFLVKLTESIQKPEAAEKLMSQTLKGVILGNCARYSKLHWGDYGLFILVVKRVKTDNGVDEYQRLGSGHFMSSRLMECATMQSIFLT
jgi:hypothetical protein